MTPKELLTRLDKRQIVVITDSEGNPLMTGSCISLWENNWFYAGYLVGHLSVKDNRLCIGLEKPYSAEEDK